MAGAVEARIRALKQHASAVVKKVRLHGRVIVTSRGRPVVQIVPLPKSNFELLVEAGEVVLPKVDLASLPSPEPGPPLSGVLAAMRRDERY